MKKRILSILLLCCMVLTLLPTAAFAANELPDVKLSVPATFDKTVDLTKQNGELKIKDSKTYLIKGSADPNWYFQYRIKIDGKNNTPHIFLDGVRLQAPKDGPAIELYGGASACLYFIGNDSELIGAENFAALQKNKTDGYLRVLVQTGTKLTCEGGRYGAGIGGSKVGIKKFSQGHGMNLHFGSLATGIYGGEILAISGVYGAGIGGGQGGVGEWIYVYSGKLTVRSVSEGAGIGGGQGGPGRFIYIKGGTVNAGSESGGAGIGSGDQDGQNKSEDAHHIEISGGTVEAWSNYAGAGIGGGRGGSGYDISITGGVVRAQGYYGAGIGGGMKGKSGNILIKDTTLTALALPLYPSSDYDYNYQPASAVGRGSKWVHWMTVMQDQEFAMTLEENIKIEASDGKSVRLSATGWQWRRSQREYERGWGTTTELLIGHVDLQRLSLPYAYNYGRVISELELRCEESTHDHEFGWAIRDDCHIWACKKCGARDPAAEMSKQNGKHSPGDWSNQKQLCTVCGHVLERDTKAPVMETLTDGESYTVEDTLDGKPGAYTFTVSDPAASGETSSGVKSVTITDVPQDGPTYRLPAPDGGNNDAGAEYTVVATDNAGNETTATVRIYRRHHEHNYGDWSKDGTSHWHECTDDDCPNREESINDKAAHVYTDDADTTCDTCGYERTITPPAHEHRYGDWRKDGTNHWHECTDADCPNREESIKDKAAHVYTDDADTTCDTCGYERTITPPAHEHIVTFDGNGGTSSVGSMTTTNQKLTSLPSASRSGSYSFDGWYTEKSGGTKITTDTVFSANTTVYAHWTYTGGGGGGYNPPVTYYTLRFETGGGSDIPSVREAYNTYIDLTKYVPTWRGHTFIGWYTERSLINKVSGVYLTKDMTVYAGWRVDENPGTGANPFTDVSEKDWFYGDVMFVYENGLMLGTSKTLFSPHGTATRGMMATILWRMEGSPAPKGKNSFTDVEAGKWYADAITWTAENGIFAGYGKDKFGPDDPITREQLAAIFYRYADYKGYDLTVKGNLDKFKDADKITDYAKTAMQWAVGSGLVKGKSGNLLDPQGTATRAEIAAMLHRFIEKYELVQGKAPGGLMGWIDPKRLQIPKTGDSSVLGLWGFSLCTSLAGCLALTTWQIRRRREEEALQIIEK